MTIIIAAEGPSLDSAPCSHFGRAPYFIEAEIETQTVVEAIANPHAGDGHGVGVTAATLVADRKPGAVVSGAFGPKAHAVLQAAGIDLCLLSGATVGEVVANFAAGKLERFESGSGGGGGGCGQGSGRGRA